GPAVVTHRGTAQPQQAGEPVGGNVAAVLFDGGQDPLAGRQAGGTASGVVGLRTRSPASSASAVAALRGGAFAQVDANSANPATGLGQARTEPGRDWRNWRSEEHTSELQSRFDLVCRLLLEKKKHTYTCGV